MIDFLRRIFYSFFREYKPNTGLLLDSPEKLAELPQHELFARGQSSVDWSLYCPPFRYQGSSYWCTAFAGTAIGSIFEKLETGKWVIFSPRELFYRSGGQLFGNYLIATAKAMQDGFVLETDVPTPIPNRWDLDEFNKYKENSTGPIRSQYADKSCAIVGTDPSSLRQALSTSPLSVAIGIGKGYFDPIAPRQTAYSAYHNVVLTSIDTDGTLTIFDSLTQSSSFNGFHRLAPDYEILLALSFIDLPDNWQDIQTEAIETANSGALGHYGKKRDLGLERMSALTFSEAIKKNPTLASLAGRNWLILVNALAYGNYSVQDLLNHLTSIRRTGRPIFNLNKVRPH